MAKKTRLFFAVILFSCLLLIIPSYCLSWTGKVVDKETGEPIEGAVVVRSWDRETAGAAGSVTTFVGMKESITSINGTFTIFNKIYFPGIPMLSWVHENKPIVYKPGYKFFILDEKDSIVRLEKVPTIQKIREEEVEKARGNYEVDLWDTYIFRDIVLREEEFVESKLDPRREASSPGQPNTQSYKIKPVSDNAVILSHGVVLARGLPSTKENPKTVNPISDKALKASKDDRVEFNIKVLSDITNSRGGRSGAANSLGSLKDHRAVPALIKALGDKETIVRSSAAAALGKIKDQRAVPYLIEATKDNNSYVRRDAVYALSEIEDPRAVPAFIDALRDSDLGIRYEAAKALGRFDDPRKIDAVEPLIYDLSNKDHNIRSKAEYALVQIGKLAVESLIRALKSEDENVRASAATALGEIGDPRAIEPLIDLIDLNNRTYSYAAVNALGSFKDERVADALVKALEFNIGDNRPVTGSLCRIGPIAADLMTAKLSDENANVRMAALDYFMCIKDNSAYEFLIKALNDENRWVRDHSVRRISILRDARFVDALIEAWHDEDAEVRTVAAHALFLIGSDATEKLIQTLNNNNSYFRWRAAWCLGSIQDKRSVEPLISTLQDKVSEVKWTAIKALGVIGDERAVKDLRSLCNDEDIGVRNEVERALIEITGKNTCGENDGRK